MFTKKIFIEAKLNLQPTLMAVILDGSRVLGCWKEFYWTACSTCWKISEWLLKLNVETYDCLGGIKTFYHAALQLIDKISHITCSTDKTAHTWKWFLLPELPLINHFQFALTRGSKLLFTLQALKLRHFQAFWAKLYKSGVVKHLMYFLNEIFWEWMLKPSVKIKRNNKSGGYGSISTEVRSIYCSHLSLMI